MTASDEYNGWKNRSTWNVALWLNNDEPLYRVYMEILEQHDDDRAAARKVEQLCRSLWGETTPDGDCLNLADYLQVVSLDRE